MRSTLRRAPFGLALLLAVAAGCEDSSFGRSAATIVTPTMPAGAARLEIRLDPQRGLAASCTDLSFSYSGTRTADAPGAPAAASSAGDTTATDDRSQRCPTPDTLAFPTRLDLMQGSWDFTVSVRLDGPTGALQLEGTCSGVPIRAQTTHVLTVTQPPTGTAATCVFSL
jgi:hypothetical protein